MDGGSQKTSILRRRIAKFGVEMKDLAECLLHFPLGRTLRDVFDPYVHRVGMKRGGKVGCRFR